MVELAGRVPLSALTTGALIDPALLAPSGFDCHGRGFFIDELRRLLTAALDDLGRPSISFRTYGD